MKYMFPENFLWGAATAAHQVEGNNINADLWAEEHSEGSPYKDKSGDAVDHYRLYRKDIELLKQLDLNTYRFSIEWARIEPEPGYYSMSQIEHYRDMLVACHENGITPMVTMHHFTSPRWLMKFGGWGNVENADRFAKYCEVVFKELGDLIPFVMTMNEINLPVLLRELFTNYNFVPPVGIDAKAWAAPEWRKSAAKACGAELDTYFTFHMASDEAGIATIKASHRKAREVIRRISPKTKVGLTFALSDVQSAKGGEENAKQTWHDYFRQYLDAIEEDDFIGVQNYTREVYGAEGKLPLPYGAEMTDAGYEYYPEALGNVVRKVALDFQKPIYITENGMATNNDSRRIDFVKSALQGLHSCIADGIDVRGYVYWTALDNFEWTFGFDPHFGIIGVDRTTQTRLVKDSAHYLGSVAQSNGFGH